LAGKNASEMTYLSFELDVSLNSIEDLVRHEEPIMEILYEAKNGVITTPKVNRFG